MTRQNKRGAEIWILEIDENLSGERTGLGGGQEEVRGLLSLMYVCLNTQHSCFSCKAGNVSQVMEYQQYRRHRAEASRGEKV